MTAQPEVTLEQVLAALDPAQYPPSKASTHRVKAAIYDQYGEPEKAAVERAVADAFASEEQALAAHLDAIARHDRHEQERDLQQIARDIAERASKQVMESLGQALLAAAHSDPARWPS